MSAADLVLMDAADYHARTDAQSASMLKVFAGSARGEGRRAYYGRYIAKTVEEESRDLLRAVFDHLYRPESVYEHFWRNGDIVIWDNIALQHMRGSLKNCGRRILQRAIVGTEGVAPHIHGMD